MKFKKGQKVRLDLNTKMGKHGILEDAHNNICVVISVGHNTYDIKDRYFFWCVYPEMLKPLGEVQLLFDFMEDE